MENRIRMALATLTSGLFFWLASFIGLSIPESGLLFTVGVIYSLALFCIAKRVKIIEIGTIIVYITGILLAVRVNLPLWAKVGLLVIQTQPIAGVVNQGLREKEIFRWVDVLVLAFSLLVITILSVW